MSKPPYEPGSELYLPEFAYLLPAMCHPGSEEIHAASSAWVREHMKFALESKVDLDALLDEGAALWTCYVLPTAQAERLQTLCEYTEFLSVFDNAMVDRAKIGKDSASAKALFADIIRVLDGDQVAGANGYGAEMRDLWRRMTDGMPSTQQVRFMAEVTRFLRGCVAEITSRQDEVVFDFETYIAIRRDSVGMGMYFVLGEYGLGLDLTEELAEHGELRDILDIALDQIMLTNDLFSFRAEVAMNDCVNALSVLVISEGMNLQEAFDHVFARIEARRVEFMRLRRLILATEWGGLPEVRSYLEAVWHMMAGNLQWSYLTSRYHGIGHKWSGVTSGIMTLWPDRTEFSVRPYRCTEAFAGVARVRVTA